MPRFGGMGTAFGRMGAGGKVAVASAASPAAWATLVDPSPAGASSGWDTFTIRQLYATGAYAGGAPAIGTKIRITLLGPSAGSAAVAAIYVGHKAAAGDPYDFDGSQVQLLVSASGSFAVGTSASVLTDEANFSFDKSKDLVVAIFFSGASSISTVTGLGTNYHEYYKAANDASTTDASGYTDGGSGINDFATLIEVFG